MTELRFDGALVRAGHPDLPAVRLVLGPDGRIASLDEIPGSPLGGRARKVIVPGFANGHAHSGMAVLRGLGDGLPTLEWLKVVWAAEAKLSEDDIHWSVQLALCEMIRNGVTAFADMFFWTERLIDSVIAAGLRIHAAPAIFGPDGVPFAAAGGQSLPGQIDLAERLGRVYAGEELVRVAYGTHAVYTCGEQVFSEVAERARRTGLPVQVHLSESPDEVENAIAATGRTPIASAHRAGILTSTTIIAHAVCATEDDLTLVAESGASIVHNPQSNMKLGSGIAPVLQMRDRGIRVALGTDGPASNDALDPLREMRLALYLQRGLHRQADVLGVDDGLEMLTVNGYRALGFEPTALEVGQTADFVVIDASSSHAEPFHSASGYIGWNATGADVTDVVVAGRPLLRDRELITLDEERIQFEVARIAARLR